ncbi:T9SS type A sorting domain-containing protein [candidate division KSB1 bacterium]|nr:T9SS type A sorting domain-containing protein [candidate division KSB1 bacterium]
MKIVKFLLFQMVIIFVNAGFSSEKKNAQIFWDNSSEWVQTNGPGGGRIYRVTHHPYDGNIIYAFGPKGQLYKSINKGEEWFLFSTITTAVQSMHTHFINPQNPLIMYCASHSDFYKSEDGGLTWRDIETNILHDRLYMYKVAVSPINPDVLYVTVTVDQEHPGTIFYTNNGGLTWEDVGAGLNIPAPLGVAAIASAGNGILFCAIHDHTFSVSKPGQLYFSDDNGTNWKKINYGQDEERFVFSITVNPYATNEVWVGERTIYGHLLDQPTLFRSKDFGQSWDPVLAPDVNLAESVEILAFGNSGQTIYVRGEYLGVSFDNGETFQDIGINVPNLPMISSSECISLDPDNDYIAYAATTAGVIKSQDGGQTWELKNKGIMNTSVNLLVTDPVDPGIVYAGSANGQGIFWSSNFGEDWEMLNVQGMWSTVGDELVVDIHDPNTLWYVADVPIIHKSIDRGESWEVLHGPWKDSSYGYNMCSISAFAQSLNENTIFVHTNGFGISKGTIESEDFIKWKFLSLSEVDYSYALNVHPFDENIFLSGYNPKPFENHAQIQKTTDGGDTWNIVLNIEGATGVGAIRRDMKNPEVLYTGITGKPGSVYKSMDGGNIWETLNDHFIMCTVWGQPQLIIHPQDESIAYAATWLGGTWKTEDSGLNWTLLEGAPISSTALSLDPSKPNEVYLADRSSPTVWKSYDSGDSWEKIADFTGDGALLVMRVLAAGDTIYASTFYHGLRGGRLYQSIDGGLNWYDITGALPKGILDIAVDPNNQDNIYVTTNINGAFRSNNGGVTWSKLENFPDVGAYDIEFDVNDSKVLYIACRGGSLPAWFTEIAGDRPDGIVFKDAAGVYKTKDSGETWVQLLTTSASCRAVRQHPVHSEWLFTVDLVDGFLFSDDGGQNWSENNEGIFTNRLTSCAVGGNSIYVGTQGCGVFSGDIIPASNSVLWDDSRSNKPVPEVHNIQIEIDPENSERIYVSAYPGGLYRSDDGGKTFQDKNAITPSIVVDDPVRQGYYTFAIHPAKTEEMWLGTWGKGIYKSLNRMDLDVPANGYDLKMMGKHFNQIIVDPTPPHTVYAATEEGVFRTDDGGTTWIAMSNGLGTPQVKTLFISAKGKLYAGTKGYAVYCWNDVEWIFFHCPLNFGRQWAAWDRILYPYTTLLFHPVDPQRMLLGSFPSGIYKSEDQGQSWIETNIGWQNDGVFSMRSHPVEPDIVYAGTYDGISRSVDFGESWEVWNKGWPEQQWVFSIDFDPTDAAVMYACSKNGENKGNGREGFQGIVMKSVDGGQSWFEITDGLKHENGQLNQEFYEIMVDYFDPSIVYLATQNEGMYISRDGGGYWQEWNEGLGSNIAATNGNNVVNVLARSADNSILYFGTEGSGVYRRMIFPILPVNRLSAEKNHQQIVLRWRFDDLNENFHHYNIYRENEFFTSIDNLFPYSTVLSLADTFFIDNSIAPNIEYYYAVTTNDENGYENPHIFTLGPIVDYQMQVLTVKLDTGQVGIFYNDSLVAEGGIPPYKFQIFSGHLPKGIKLNGLSGVFSGIPEEEGTFDFMLRYWDAQQPPMADTLQLSIHILATSGVQLSGINLPEKFKLFPNYPNPFNPVTQIRFALPKPEWVRICIFDIQGRLAATILKRYCNPGYHEIGWDCSNMPSGTYFIHISAGDFTARQKCLLLK